MRTLIILFLITGCREPENPKTDTAPAGDDTDENVDPFIDEDGDGFIDDCDDTNPDVFPGAIEICDGLDNDCNNAVDDNAVDAAAWYLDDDGDGYGDADEETPSCDALVGHVANSDDCDDQDARFNPSAIESDCEDPNEYNCDGSVGWADADSDGFAACADCDDSDSAVNDDALEICNGVDDNCDGHTDEDDPELSEDSDGDGHGGQQYEAIGCDAPAGFVDNNDDCDDLNADTYPSAAEVCDEDDNDCDGDIDEGVGFTWYADTDSDGYGDATQTTIACDAPQGYTANGNDCDDSAPSVNPGGVEVCNGADDDCDGTVDGASSINASTFYADTDADGYGDGAASVTACEEPSNHVTNDGDCDDTNATTNPGATETCNGTDDNCDGATDEGVLSTFYADLDGDSYGSTVSQQACSAPAAHVSDNTDCDDTNATTNPGATETCNGTDDNCDGATDEGVLSTFYADLDSDSYGDPGTPLIACSLPSGASANALDCNDALPLVNPAAAELCDAIDNNCTGGIDEDFDGDSDGVSSCGPDGVPGTSDDDCDDSDADSYPGNTEVCDALDNNCSGSIDEGFDGDSDSFTTCGADGLSGTSDDDCDDSSSGALFYPGASEACDDPDYNCDGVVPLSCILASCAAYLADDPSSADGTYTIDPENNGTGFQVYCDMTGGGWTLVVKAASTNHAIMRSAAAGGLTGNNGPDYSFSGSTDQKLSDDIIKLIFTSELRMTTQNGGVEAISTTNIQALSSFSDRCGCSCNLDWVYRGTNFPASAGNTHHYDCGWDAYIRQGGGEGPCLFFSHDGYVTHEKSGQCSGHECGYGFGWVR